MKILIKVVRENIALEVIDNNFRTFFRIVVRYSLVV